MEQTFDTYYPLVNNNNLNLFKNEIQNFIRPNAENVFNCHNLNGENMLKDFAMVYVIYKVTRLNTVFKIQ